MSLFARACVSCRASKSGDGEGTRDAVESRDDGAAAFNDARSPSCSGRSPSGCAAPALPVSTRGGRFCFGTACQLSRHILVSSCEPRRGCAHPS